MASVTSAASSAWGTYPTRFITLLRIAGWRRPPSRRGTACVHSCARAASMAATSTDVPCHVSPPRSRSAAVIAHLPSEPAPPPPIALHEVIGRGRTPRAGLVVGEGRTWSVLPTLQRACNKGPFCLHLVAPREQRGVAQHAVEQQPLIGVGRCGAKRGAVQEIHVHRADLHAGAGHLGAEAQRDALVGLDVHGQHVWLQGLSRSRAEEQVRRAPELHRDLGGPLGQPLARTQVEWHTLPPPAIDEQLQRHEGLAHGVRRNTRLLPVPGDLGTANPAAAILAPYGTAYSLVAGHGPQRAQHL